MNWKFAGVLVCVLSVFGCNNDVERPASPQRSGGGVTVETPQGKVMVQNAIANLDEKYVTADVLGDGVQYIFRVSAVAHGNSVTGGVAELLDPSGAPLYSITTLTNIETGEVTFTHATEDDYLTLSIVNDDERVREQYDANGDVASFEYPLLSDDTQRRAVNAYQHGVTPGVLPDRVQEYIAQVGAFDAYYEPHATSTLHNNPYGEVLVNILASPELNTLVPGDIGDEASWVGVQNFCQLARACQSLVCYTNPGSLVCFACTALSVGCAIMDFICTFLGC